MKVKTGRSSKIRFWVSSYGSLVLTLSLSVGIFYFLVIPWTRTSLKNRVEARETRELNEAELAPKIAFLESLEKEPLKENLDQLELIIPSGKALGLVFSNLEWLAAQKEVLISGLQYSAPLAAEQAAAEDQTDQQAEVIGLSFLVSGDSTRLGDYLESLQLVAPYLKVSEITYAAARAETDQKMGQMSLRLDTFYQPLPAQLPPIEEPLPELTAPEKNLLDQIGRFRPVAPAVGPGTGELESAEEVNVDYGQEDPFGF